MIEKNVVKLNDVIFVYSNPPQQAMVGVVDSIDYPIITVLIVPRSERNNFKKIEKIDISGNIPLTILEEIEMKRILTPKEIKKIEELQNEEEDLFAGMY